MEKAKWGSDSDFNFEDLDPMNVTRAGAGVSIQFLEFQGYDAP